MKLSEILDKLSDDFSFSWLPKILLGMSLKTEKNTNQKYAEAKIIIPKYIDDLRDLDGEKAKYVMFLGMIPRDKFDNLLNKAKEENILLKDNENLASENERLIKILNKNKIDY